MAETSHLQHLAILTCDCTGSLFMHPCLDLWCSLATGSAAPGVVPVRALMMVGLEDSIHLMQWSVYMLRAKAQCCTLADAMMVLWYLSGWWSVNRRPRKNWWKHFIPKMMASAPLSSCKYFLCACKRDLDANAIASLCHLPSRVIRLPLPYHFHLHPRLPLQPVFLHKNVLLRTLMYNPIVSMEQSTGLSNGFSHVPLK